MVLFDLSDTENELTTEVGGYEHVVVSQNIKVVDGHLVETLQQLPQGTHAGDCILLTSSCFWLLEIALVCETLVAAISSWPEPSAENFAILTFVLL